MKSAPKIAYVTSGDANDVRGWSGLNPHLYNAPGAQGMGSKLVGGLHHGLALGRTPRKRWGRWAERRDYNPCMASARSAERIEFLFVGMDWERKGAAKAVAVVGELRGRAGGEGA